MTDSSPPSIDDDWGKHQFVSAEEVVKFFEESGISVLDIHAHCRLLNILRIPEEIQDSSDWEENLSNRTVEMLVRMRQEPSLRGLAGHFVVY